MGERRAPDMVGYHGLDRSENSLASRITQLEADIARKDKALASIERKARELAEDRMASNRGLWLACADEARSALSNATTPETGGTP